MIKAPKSFLRKIGLRKNLLCELVIIKWYDANTRNESMSMILERPFVVNESVGWLVYYDSIKVIIAIEKSDIAERDHTTIPTGWVKEVVAV